MINGYMAFAIVMLWMWLGSACLNASGEKEYFLSAVIMLNVWMAAIFVACYLEKL